VAATELVWGTPQHSGLSGGWFVEVQARESGVVAAVIASKKREKVGFFG
jgi:hypothetical protein